jgi:hypothetical protein
MVRLLPIYDRGKPLGQAQHILVHALVDGDTILKTVEVDGHGVMQRWCRWRW